MKAAAFWQPSVREHFSAQPPACWTEDRPPRTGAPRPDCNRLFPALRIDPDRLLVDDGDILTVGGVMSRPDVALRLTERLLRSAVMLETARYLLIDPPRHDQRQYRHFAPSLTHCDRAILKVQHWLRTEPARDATVAYMTRLSGLEERTFLRRFHTATSLTALAYQQHLRVEKGRDLLETTYFPAARPDCVGGRISGQWGFPENLHTIYGTATRRLSEAI